MADSKIGGRHDGLKANPAIAVPGGPVVLVVMDGVGHGRGDEYDAVAQARTPTLDRLRKDGLSRTIHAHGPYVGLPSETDMGNSEVGHNALGAGRIFDQGAKRINNAIESAAIWGGVWREIVERLKTKRSSLHLIGLLSDGNVHSHLDHLFALLDRARSEGISRVYVHGLLDGRDVPDFSADRYVGIVEQHLASITADTGLDYRIASGGGRMLTTMDRYEADWRIVERGWRAHVLGTERPFESATQAINTLREENPGISDQLLPAFTVVRDSEPVGRVRDGDAVVLFNFRGDRSIELARALTEGEGFKGFDRGTVPEVLFAGMTLYDGDTNMPERRLVEPETVPDTVSEYLARTGITQWAGAETQKYGHVTYFWNGNCSDKFDQRTETYVEVPSDRVRFDQRPWMKSAETADEVIEAVRSGSYRFIRVNFAGGDMVGHTGSFIPTVIAVEAVDLAIERICREVEQVGGCLVVTADHGNAEDMVQRDKRGQPLFKDGEPRWKTSHSVNPVPFLVMDYTGRAITLRQDIPDAGLANVAATIVDLLGYEAPAIYEPSLIAPATT